MLRNPSRRPWLVIADGAFASTSLAVELSTLYNINFIGPVKVCSIQSHKNLTNKLQLADQDALVTVTKMKLPWKNLILKILHLFALQVTSTQL